MALADSWQFGRVKCTVESMMFDVSGSRRFYWQGRIWFNEYAYYYEVTATQSYCCKV